MLVLLGVAAYLVGSAFFITTAFIWYLMAKEDYREPFRAFCPETMQPVELTVDGTLAAKSRFAGHERIAIATCSRWPERQECDQPCTPQVAFLGDSRRPVKWAAFALPPQFLRINNPVQMTRELYDRITQQLQKQHETGKIA